MDSAKKYLPHYTYDDWVHWEGKWELIEGHPIAMSPTPVPGHQRAAAEIRYAIMDALKKSNCKNCRAYDPLDFIISNDTILVPDILVICGEVKKKFLDFPPALVVEILSPSTALRDRNTKYAYYLQQGVKYYLIVDVEHKKIEVFQLENGQYNLQPPGAYKFIFTEDCTITPDLENVFD